ncbi:2-cysteine peroxiredoxin [Exidia glandulosa HHB12029]|uniref:thioredoxin-dependent peroxiredoxin n=1 Tax=Exidia glandulosa HHB12029 TaxID=1314781 RepID=A0A165Q801_EXIGL|nr:2-cysteine peroxiredoxin [Exidia glandulosa HHB12029]
MVATVQKPAPNFAGTVVENGEFKEVTLQTYAGKWLVFFFYPMDFTFVCPTEILAFNDALPQFQALNTAVVAVSTDSKYSHFAWATQPREKGGLGPSLALPLLADRSMSISRDYGVLIEEEGIALRGLFLIDPKGILRQITVNDLPVGRSVDETLRLIEAFQFTDEFGEVCPANWKKGSKTIKATPTDSLEYFSAAGNGATNGLKRPANGDANGTAEKKV